MDEKFISFHSNTKLCIRSKEEKEDKKKEEIIIYDHCHYPIPLCILFK